VITIKREFSSTENQHITVEFPHAVCLLSVALQLTGYTNSSAIVDGIELAGGINPGISPGNFITLKKFEFLCSWDDQVPAPSGILIVGLEGNLGKNRI